MNKKNLFRDVKDGQIWVCYVDKVHGNAYLTIDEKRFGSGWSISLGTLTKSGVDFYNLYHHAQVYKR